MDTFENPIHLDSVYVRVWFCANVELSTDRAGTDVG